MYKRQALERAHDPLDEPQGSNGFAIAPSNAAGRHALLLINPHTSFFFRSELQVTSDEGLDAYGAATWGQFFVYQGFNERLGWMHTSSGVDNVDFFGEIIVREGGGLFYRHGKELRPVQATKVSIDYRASDGSMARRVFSVFRTHHGPVVREEEGRWVSATMMFRPVEALSQSFLLTKARDLPGFLQVMELRANSSNNTVYADADGNIAYLHPQFVPRRDDRFDYTRTVDGADPATDWKGLHELAELPQVVNPPNGWIANTNNWPYSAAGPYSPRRESFPRYMDTHGENPRGLHAALVLENRKDFTADTLESAAFDPFLPAFARLLPGLMAAFDRLDEKDPRRAGLADAVALLRDWDCRWSAGSVATTLAVLWGDALWSEAEAPAARARIPVYEQVAERTDDEARLAALSRVTGRLRRDFGDWRVPWGEVNRFQRIGDGNEEAFRDDRPSVPVPFAAGRWGSLASFSARRYPGSNRYYGSSGNSFVAIVEFGPRVSARAVTIGGESGDPASPHFADQVDRYARGALRRVYFHPGELDGHVERIYRPE